MGIVAAAAGRQDSNDVIERIQEKRRSFSQSFS